MTDVCKGTGVNQVVNTEQVETVTDFFMAECEKMNKFAYAVGDFFYSWGFDSPESAAEHIKANFTEGKHYECDESFADEAAYVCVDRSTYLKLIETKLDCSPVIAEQNKKAPNKLKEKGLEDELERWIIKNGITVERQVSTKSKHRLDLWIPGIMMLELKVGNINGEDVCQAIDYYATYSRRLLLVGNTLTNGARNMRDNVRKNDERNPLPAGGSSNKDSQNNSIFCSASKPVDGFKLFCWACVLSNTGSSYGVISGTRDKSLESLWLLAFSFRKEGIFRLDIVTIWYLRVYCCYKDTLEKYKNTLRKIFFGALSTNFLRLAKCVSDTQVSRSIHMVTFAYKSNTSDKPNLLLGWTVLLSLLQKRFSRALSASSTPEHLPGFKEVEELVELLVGEPSAEVVRAIAHKPGTLHELTIEILSNKSVFEQRHLRDKAIDLSTEVEWRLSDLTQTEDWYFDVRVTKKFDINLEQGWLVTSKNAESQHLSAAS